MWTNPALRFLRNEEIVEWDIKAANVSLMQMYSLASEDTISAIRNMDGHDRKVAVGKLYLKDKTFGPRLEQAFTDIIERREKIILIEIETLYPSSEMLYSFETGLFETTSLMTAFCLGQKVDTPDICISRILRRS